MAQPGLPLLPLPLPAAVTLIPSAADIDALSPSALRTLYDSLQPLHAVTLTPRPTHGQGNHGITLKNKLNQLRDMLAAPVNLVDLALAPVNPLPLHLHLAAEIPANAAVIPLPQHQNQADATLPVLPALPLLDQQQQQQQQLTTIAA